MYFSSLSELVYMDGHGPYVWSVYGVAALILGALAIGPVLARRRFIRGEAQRLRRGQRDGARPAVELGGAASVPGTVVHKLSDGGG